MYTIFYENDSNRTLSRNADTYKAAVALARQLKGRAYHADTRPEKPLR